MDLNDSASDLTSQDMPEDFVFSDKTTYESFGESLNVLRRNREFTDVTLQVGKLDISGHKCVLAVASPRLFQLFLKEPTSTTFYLDEWGLEFEALTKLVDFAYTCRLEAKEEDVRLLFRTASKLQMDGVTKACGSYLAEHINVQNCIGVRSIINQELTVEIANKLEQFIRENFAEAILSPDFVALARVQIEVICSEESKRKKEFDLCQMVVDWIRRCMVDEEWTLGSMTEKVHLLYLKDDETDYSLHDCLELDEKDVQDRELSRQTCVQDYKILSKGYPVHSQKNGLKANSRANSLNRNADRRKLWGTSSHDLLRENGEGSKWKVIAARPTADRTQIALAVTDRKLLSMSIVLRTATAAAGTDAVDSMVVHEENGVDTKNGIPMSTMKVPRCAFGAASFEGKIIVAGGYNRGECLETFEIYDPKKNTWTSLPSMLSPRGRFDIAVVERVVYAVCGSDGTKDLQTAECYWFEESSPVWEPIASLSSPRSSTVTCTLDGRVLCVGGWSGQSVMKNVDAYDPATDQWLSYASLQTSRSQAGIDLLDGRVYVVGGCDNWDRLNTVEVYDPRQESWSFTAPLQIARRGAGVTHYKGNLYVIGGSDGTQSLSSTEVYDPRMNRWTSGPPLANSRANIEAVELNGRLFAIGGYSGKTFLNSMEVLQDDTWTDFISL